MPAQLRRASLALPLALATVVALAACSGGSGGGTPKDAGDNGTVKQSAAPSAAPKALDIANLDACTILPQPDAETLVGTKLVNPLKANNSDVASCTYQGDPNGPTSQVEVYVGDGAKQQLEIDRDKLKHKFIQPTGLGDEAWQEDEWIWARTGTTWMSIRIVRLDDAAKYVTPLQTAMATALKNLAAL